MLDETDLNELLRIASKQNLFVVNDAAYCSLAEEKFIPLWSLPGGDKAGLEIFSFPYTFGMPYLPFGFAIGTPEVIGGLINIRKTIGLTLPKIWIDSAIKAIEDYPNDDLKEVRKLIAKSRLEAARLIEKVGWNRIGDRSCPFLWVKIPDRLTSQLGLPQGIGICGGILQMKVSARGANGLIDRINQNTEKQGA